MTEDDNIQNATTLAGFIDAVNQHFQTELISPSLPNNSPLASIWQKAIRVFKGAIIRVIGGKQTELTTYSAYSSEIVDILPFKFANLINHQYDLTLIPVATVNDLQSTGQNLMYVAKVGEIYHARIFSDTGSTVFGIEDSKIQPEEALKLRLDNLFQGSSDNVPISVSDTEKVELIQDIASNIGHTLMLKFKAKITVETLDSS